MAPNFWMVVLVHHSFHKNIKQQKPFSTLIKIRTIINNWAANQNIRMISEGLCDIKDCSNDAENSALPSQE